MAKASTDIMTALNHLRGQTVELRTKTGDWFYGTLQLRQVDTVTSYWRVLDDDDISHIIDPDSVQTLSVHADWLD